MRLNGWQLAGVWLTAFWMVGIAMFAKHSGWSVAVGPVLVLWGTGYLIAFIRRRLASRKAADEG